VTARLLQIDDVTSTAIRALYDYWQGLHRNGPLPAKRDIDPAAIKPLLPYVIIVEIHRDPFRVRYRLVGTEAVRFAGWDYTGVWLHEADWGEVTEVMISNYQRVAETGKPMFGADDVLINDKWKEYEWAILPLSDDGSTVTHCLVMEDSRHFERRGYSFR